MITSYTHIFAIMIASHSITHLVSYLYLQCTYLSWNLGQNTNIEQDYTSEVQPSHFNPNIHVFCVTCVSHIIFKFKTLVFLFFSNDSLLSIELK